MRGVAAVVLLLSLAACGGSAPTFHPAARVASPSPRVEVPAELSLTPAPGSTGLPVSTEIGTAVTGGHITSVSLVDGAGHAVAGALRDDASSWVPAEPLSFTTTYAATVTGTGGVSRQTHFTTMAKPSGTRIGSGLYLFSGHTYGVAMPVAVEFESDIPQPARASVQRRLFVKSDPPQAGGWHWFSARQVLYRPENYWQPGTTLTVRAALAGLPIGKRFGDTDRAATATIGRKLAIDVDNATKQMSVYQNDSLLRVVPVSLGKASTPSSSGTMVIMDKEASTIFDTTDTDGAAGYRVSIAYAQRLTWGGQFIHAAPWSVSSQGHRNVSHGCVNVATANARWLFDETLVGDPVTVRGTTRDLTPGDGWTAWNIPWSAYPQ
jgi:lipoprotein-anchoring transpeptidase ErfK/SrfK/predicted small lipoprotein YifL